MVVLLLAGYAGLLTRLGRPAWIGRWAAVLLAATGLELLLLALPVVSERKTLARAEVRGPRGYYDATVAALAYVQQHDSSFYRVDKDYYSGISRVASYDEALVQHFRGSRSYHPFNNLDYVHFLASLGAITPGCEPCTRWLPGLSHYPQAMQLCGVRYLLSAQDSVARYQRQGFKVVAQVQGLNILRNRRAWPLGVVLTRYLPENEFAQLDSAGRQQCLQRAAVVPAGLLPALTGLSRLNPAAPDTATAVTGAVRWTRQTDNELRGQLGLRQPGLLFLAIPFDAGWMLMVNGQPVPLQRLYAGLQGTVLAQGQYTLLLRYQDPYRRWGGWLSLASLVALASLWPWLRTSSYAG